MFVHNTAPYLLWLFDRITPLYCRIQHSPRLIPFVNKSHTAPNHILDLNPHLISTITVRLWSSSVRARYLDTIGIMYLNTAAPIGYKAAQSNLPQQLPLLLPPLLPPPFIVFKCSQRKQSRAVALMEKSHSKKMIECRDSLVRVNSQSRVNPFALKYCGRGNTLCASLAHSPIHPQDHCTKYFQDWNLIVSRLQQCTNGFLTGGLCLQLCQLLCATATHCLRYTNLL